MFATADEGSRESVDAKCKQLTASWVREKHVSNPDVEVCDFYETLEAAGADAVLEPGVYTLQVIPFIGCLYDSGAAAVLEAGLRIPGALRQTSGWCVIPALSCLHSECSTVLYIDHLGQVKPFHC
jgi:hypothetical protein